ncbi:MAG: ABC transporter permease [Bryobacteraceae bacterium]
MLTDLLRAVRFLTKTPLFAAAIVAILAIGIGANTAVFSIVDAVLLRPLPYESSSRLVRIVANAKARRIADRVFAQDYLAWHSRTDLFEKLAAHLRDDVTVTGLGEPRQIISRRVTPEFFSLLGAPAKLGRVLPDAENAPDQAVLSDRLWRSMFNADPAVIGRAFRIFDEVYTIVGVMPKEFEFPDSVAEMWIPMRLTAATNPMIDVVARINSRVEISQVQSAMEVVARQLEQQDKPKYEGLRIGVSQWREVPAQRYELTIVFILAAVGLVLLIACADVGSLLLTRAVQRQREIAIRASLGAGFWRVMRQLLAESFVLALLGSAAGIAVAYFGLQVLTKQISALPVALPHLQQVSLNGRVLLFNTVLCLALAILCSIAPVLLASKVDLQSVLRGGPSTGPVRGSARLFQILIATEAAFAFLLLVGSGLMVRSLIQLQDADHGWNPDHVLTLRVPVGSLTQTRPRGRFETKPQQMAHYKELLDAVQALPGVRAAAVVNNPPLSDVNTATNLTGPNGELLQFPTRTVSADYFSVMGIPVVAGRTFTDADRQDAPSVAIISESLARQLFPNRDPIGQAIAEDGKPPGVAVVGVVKDAPQMSYEQPAKGEIYRPYRQMIFGVFMSTLIVRTSGEPLALANSIRQAVWKADPNQPIVKVASMNEVIANSIWRPRFSAWIFSILGVLALLLTSAGVYSVVAYTTEMRAREVGIRVALGASPRRVVAVILRDAMIPLLAGLALSVAGALFLSRFLSSLLYEITPTDPATFIVSALVLLAIGGVASARPAWKAATGDPLTALRNE